MSTRKETSDPAIVILTDSAKVDGGITRVAVDSAIALKKAGREVYYFAAIGPADAELAAALGENIVLLDQKDILSEKNRLLASTRGIVNFSASKALTDFLARFGERGAIVHLHGWCKALSPLILRTLARSGVPVVASIHEYFLACPNGAFYDFQEGAICTRKPLSLDCVRCNCDARSYKHKLWRLGRSWVQRHVLGVPEGLRHFITISPLNRKIISPFLPANACVHDLSNPIRIEKHERTRAEENNLFLFVGRISKEKGVLDFAKAAGALDLKAEFVGDGPLRAEAQALAPKATFHGWLSSREVMAKIRTARIVVFPSTWYEGQPLVPIEAAANGVPCILSDCNAAVDYLPDKVRGIQFKQGDVEDLKRALREAGSDEYVRQLSGRVYDWYWENPWTIERHIEGLQDIYLKVFREGRQDPYEK